MTEEKIGQWADIFPNLRNSSTEDPRIFQTPWEKTTNTLDAPKKKIYFACVVGGNCYGIDVIRPWAYDAKKECLGAFLKMKRAVYYYEKNGEWPKDTPHGDN